VEEGGAATAFGALIHEINPGPECGANEANLERFCPQLHIQKRRSPSWLGAEPQETEGRGKVVPGPIQRACRHATAVKAVVFLIGKLGPYSKLVPGNTGMPTGT